MRKKAAAKAKLYRFIGVSLAGGKSDKTALAVIEYYPAAGKIALVKLIEKIKTEHEISADLRIHELISQYRRDVTRLALDVPLTWPKCLDCDLPCPGYEICEEPEIKWLWKHIEGIQKNKKPKKLFSPYAERCVDHFVANDLEEKFQLQPAMGANGAPLLARAYFLSRRTDQDFLEVFPRLSLWRIGVNLKIAKSHVRNYRHAATGDESRAIILNHLNREKNIFFYDQDERTMIENAHAFDAYLCALSGFLDWRDQSEPKPKNFPEDGGWITFPRQDFKW